MMDIQKRIKLFCFPYAGGSSAVYSKWSGLINKRLIDLRMIELAGRGIRMQEPLYKDVDEMINDIFTQIQPELDDGPFAFFGHSMGAMIAYELTRKLQQEQLPLPVHVFFSGRGAPHIKKGRMFHNLEPEDFRRELILLGGIPDGFFDNEELAALFLPILRNDFRLSEIAPFEEKITPLDSNITIFIGASEDLSPDQRSGWNQHTKGNCRIYEFDGGHFFINEKALPVIRIIEQVCLPVSSYHL